MPNGTELIGTVIGNREKMKSRKSVPVAVSEKRKRVVSI